MDVSSIAELFGKSAPLVNIAIALIVALIFYIFYHVFTGLFNRYIQQSEKAIEKVIDLEHRIKVLEMNYAHIAEGQKQMFMKLDKMDDELRRNREVLLDKLEKMDRKNN